MFDIRRRKFITLLGAAVTRGSDVLRAKLPSRHHGRAADYVDRF
jgi:hypothetical protein